MVSAFFQRPGHFVCRDALSALGAGIFRLFPAPDIHPARDSYSHARAGGGAYRRLSEVIIMTGGEIAAIITAIVGALIGVSGVFISIATSHRAAKKDKVDSLFRMVETLQAENARLIARIETLESDLEQRERRIAMLERSLRETTEARQERERRIKELETEIAELSTKVAVLVAKEAAV